MRRLCSYVHLCQLLEQHLAGKTGDDMEGEDDEAAWNEWSSDDGSDSDSEDGWQNVDSDSDADLDISDSDDEEDEKTRRQLKREQKAKRARQLAGLPVEESEEEEEEEKADEDENEDEDGQSEAAVSEATAEVKLDPSVGSMSQLATQKVRPSYPLFPKRLSGSDHLAHRCYFPSSL